MHEPVKTTAISEKNQQDSVAVVNASKNETTRTQTQIPSTTNTTIQDNPRESNDDQSIKQRELRQLDLKLKKREEQLRLKEMAINDESKEKTRLFDRINKLESRNTDLEKTIKTKLNKIGTLENDHEKLKHNNMTNDIHQRNLPMNDRNSSSNGLIEGVREKVTNYIFRKVDQEIDQLINKENNIIHTTDGRANTHHVNDYGHTNYYDYERGWKNWQNLPGPLDLTGYIMNPRKVAAHMSTRL